jgi:CRISPR/Cas system CMR-associated protein Cmr3 (group 5 of RAMP superfamily)
MRIFVEKNREVLKNDILGFGFSKKYEIKKISNVRASGYFGTPDMFNLVVWNIVGGTIAFDYEGKTIRFGIALEEAEAKEAENILNNYLKK